MKINRKALCKRCLKIIRQQEREYFERNRGRMTDYRRTYQNTDEYRKWRKTYTTTDEYRARARERYRRKKALSKSS